MKRSYKEDSKYFDELTKYRHKCKCGHSIIMTPKTTKKLCKWCGHYVYINEREKERENFIKKLKEKLK